MNYLYNKFSTITLALLCVWMMTACQMEVVTLAPHGPVPPIGSSGVLAHPATSAVGDEALALEALPVAETAVDVLAVEIAVEQASTGASTETSTEISTEATIEATVETAARVDDLPAADAAPVETPASQEAATGDAVQNSGLPAPPVRLRIPSINVDAPVEHVGKTPSGAMDVPANVWHVAWYEPGTVPGNAGNAVLSGHLDDYRGEPTVFAYLYRLQPGDRAVITDENGAVREFEVTKVASYGWDDAPLLEVFGPENEADLNLITCGGTWNEAAQNYSERLVVYTRLVEPAE